MYLYICLSYPFYFRKFFRDATLVLGTTASVSLTRDLITKKELKGQEADLWLSSLAFIPKPTKDMLREISVSI